MEQLLLEVCGPRTMEASGNLSLIDPLENLQKTKWKEKISSFQISYVWILLPYIF